MRQTATGIFFHPDIMDKKGRIGLGTSPHFELPKEVAEKLLNGIELGDVIDELTSRMVNDQGLLQ